MSISSVSVTRVAAFLTHVAERNRRGGWALETMGAKLAAPSRSTSQHRRCGGGADFADLDL
jgi:hypothetical protein